MTLLKALKRFLPMARMIAPRRSLLPALKRIYFRDGELIASDLEHHVIASLSTGGDYQIPVKTISDILSNKPESLVIREKATDHGYDMLKITFDGITATIPRSSGDYPLLPQGDYERVGLWSRALVEMLEQQIPFVSHDELKPSLMGIQVEIVDGIIESAATNGHVLRHVRNWNFDDRKNDYSEDFTGIITTKTIKFLAKFMGNSVQVAKTGSHLRFTLDDCVFYSRLIDEKFPDYRSVMLTKRKGSAYFDRNAALKVLRGLKPFCNPTTKQITIGTTPTAAALTAVDVETNSRGEGSFPIDNAEGEIVIGYNIDYLVNALKSCGSPIRWEWGSPVEAALFFEAEQEDVRVLLMPVRLND